MVRSCGRRTSTSGLGTVAFVGRPGRRVAAIVVIWLIGGWGASALDPDREGRPDIRGNRLAVQAGAAGDRPHAFTAQPPTKNLSHFHHPELRIGHGPSFRRAA